MTHRVYESLSVRYTLHANKRRRHGRPRGHRRAWVFREVGVLKAGGQLMLPAPTADRIFLNRRFRLHR